MSDRELIVEYMASLDREKVLAMTEKMLSAGIAPGEIFSLLHRGNDLVRNSYSAGEYFIADLIMADVIFKDAVKLTIGMGEEYVRPVLGKVLIGCVQGDIHELGKSLVQIILDYNGFQVEDMGVDVTPEKFVSAVMTFAPDILVLCGTMSGSEIMMARTIEAIENAGLRSCVKIMLGGACVTEKQALAIGADGYSSEPGDGLSLCRRFMQMEE